MFSQMRLSRKTKGMQLQQDGLRAAVYGKDIYFPVRFMQNSGVLRLWTLTSKLSPQLRMSLIRMSFAWGAAHRCTSGACTPRDHICL